MSVCLLYHDDVTPTNINEAISSVVVIREITKIIRFLPPTVPDEDVAPVPRALCMLANTTTIAETWARLDVKFDLMFAKRAFVY
ncbi:unnamed protein product, partial [Onchocerca ochengi]|uniref:Tubulin_C domain-containing protein n=1 Tax=Onchocerca ochengi TaxID=42157 RepID=A0A182EW04_ONCOC